MIHYAHNYQESFSSLACWKIWRSNFGTLPHNLGFSSQFFWRPKVKIRSNSFNWNIPLCLSWKVEWKSFKMSKLSSYQTFFCQWLNYRYVNWSTLICNLLAHIVHSCSNTCSKSNILISRLSALLSDYDLYESSSSAVGLKSFMEQNRLVVHSILIIIFQLRSL